MLLQVLLFVVGISAYALVLQMLAASAVEKERVALSKFSSALSNAEDNIDHAVRMAKFGNKLLPIGSNTKEYCKLFR